MKSVFEKRYPIGKKVEYRISSNHPRTIALAAPGFLILMGIGIGCFAAIAFYPGQELHFIAGFILSIAAAIGWMFFALHYGKRHFEQDAPPSGKTDGDSGSHKGK